MASFYVRQWDHSNPRAVILLMHGLGEFVDRYDWAASQFVEHGYAVIGADLPGHGKTVGQSGGKPGYIRRFEDFFEATNHELRIAQERYPGKPLVFFGHSMGGLAVVRYFQTQPVPENTAAVLLSSPCLEFAFSVPASQVRSMRLISRIWPGLLQPSNIQPSDVSRSPEIQQVYAENPLILHKVSVRLLQQMYDTMIETRAAGKPFTVPVFLAQAGQDKLVSAETNRQFVEGLTAPEKVFQLYPPCHHELLNEPERMDIFTDMVNWLDSKLKATGS